MYSGYALHISVTNFCNSLPPEDVRRKDVRKRGKKKNSGGWIILMTFKIMSPEDESSMKYFQTNFINGMGVSLSIHGGVAVGRRQHKPYYWTVKSGAKWLIGCFKPVKPVITPQLWR